MCEHKRKIGWYIATDTGSVDRRMDFKCFQTSGHAFSPFACLPHHMNHVMFTGVSLHLYGDQEKGERRRTIERGRERERERERIYSQFSSFEQTPANSKATK